MEGLDYYKSLISDDEVISALIKDSRVREGEIEKTRVRPNINFFQRTVSNLVSSNNRISDNQEKFIAKEKKKNKRSRQRSFPVRKKLAIDYIKEILSERIEFTKSKEQEGTEKHTDSSNLTDDDKLRIGKPPSNDIKLSQKRVFVCKKTPFQQIREILSNNVDKSNSPSSSYEGKESAVLKNEANHEIEDVSSSNKNSVSDIKRKFSDLSTNANKSKRSKHENLKGRRSSSSSDDSSDFQCSSTKMDQSKVHKKSNIRKTTDSSDDSSSRTDHRISMKKSSSAHSSRKPKIRERSDSSDISDHRPSVYKKSSSLSKKIVHFRQRRKSSESSVISVSDASNNKDSDSDVCIVEEQR